MQLQGPSSPTWFSDSVALNTIVPMNNDLKNACLELQLLTCG